MEVAVRYFRPVASSILLRHTRASTSIQVCRRAHGSWRLVSGRNSGSFTIESGSLGVGPRALKLAAQVFTTALHVACMASVHTYQRRSSSSLFLHRPVNWFASFPYALPAAERRFLFEELLSSFGRYLMPLDLHEPFSKASMVQGHNLSQPLPAMPHRFTYRSG